MLFILFFFLLFLIFDPPPSTDHAIVVAHYCCYFIPARIYKSNVVILSTLQALLKALSSNSTWNIILDIQSNYYEKTVAVLFRSTNGRVTTTSF